MDRITLRSLAIYSAIALALGVFVVGGVILTKNFETSYNNSHKVAQTHQPSSSSTGNSNNSMPQPNNSGNQQPSQGGANQPTSGSTQQGSGSTNGSGSTSQPTPTPNSPSTPTTGSSNPTPTTKPQVPSTGTGSDMLITGLLLSLAVYFALVIYQTRNAVRRHISS